MDGVLAWVAWVACLRRFRASLDCILLCAAWVVWLVACQSGWYEWRANVGGMLILLLLLLLKYFPEKNKFEGLLLKQK